ncbi:FAP256 [Auxenochlorella protothecoides x Auxenochlorella symbiontica]
MAEIIPFSVIHCTSEEHGHPCTSLERGGSTSGWASARDSPFPQEVTLQLRGAVRLTQLQLLAHEYKIASKVEIRVAEDAAAPAWRSLGFLSFSPNDRSGHAAREMKSVALPGPPAHLVQLIFHGWHPNALNAHGQVGLVSLAVSGEALPGQPPPSPARSPVVKRGAPGTPPRAAPGESRLPPPPGIHGGAVGPPAAREAQSTPTRLATGFAGGAPAAARPARPQIAADPCSPSRADSTGTQARTLAVGRRTPDARVDPVTAAQIDTLQRQKAAAVEAEDYDEAKRLKSAIDRLCSLGARIAGLETRKAAAVAAEDYDLAKEIKAEVDGLRRVSQRGSPARAHGSGQEGEDPRDPGPRPPSPPIPTPVRPDLQQAPPGGLAGLRASLVAAASHMGAEVERMSRERAAETSLGDEGSSGDLGPGSSGARPAPGERGDGEGRTSASTLWAEHPPPPGFPADLPLPEPLSAAAAKDADELVQLIGPYASACLLSKTWQLRVAALQWLEAGAGRPPGLLADPDNFGLLARTLSAALHDRVAAAYLAALPALLLLAQCQGLPRGRVVSGLTDAVAVLVEKSGDLNARVAEASTGTLLALVRAGATQLASAPGALLRAPRPGAAPRAVLGRLALARALVRELGVAAPGGARAGLPVEALCAFLAPALGHTAGEVRSAAVDLCVLVGEVAGPGIFAHLLPSNLNPKLREAVLSGGNATSPSRRASTQTEAARDGARASPAMPAGGRRGPPEPGGTVSHKAASQRRPGAQHRPHASSGEHEAARGRGRPASDPFAKAAPLQASPLGSEASSPSIRAGGADDDDAALFAAELAAREARLGPAHPEVADALSNLAIVHNQRGETSLALPLYQRALRIWEGALGPDHPEVAHALTDIAVIFLERGEDAKGRPLLARALAIQELELGPAHPDVVAIREVLEESAAA